MVLLIRAPEGLEPSRSTRCSAHCMTLSVFRAGHHPIDDVEVANFTIPGYPAITQITFLACCAQYPGGSNRCACRFLPCPCCLPRLTGGSASTTSLSRPAQASLTLRPARLLARLIADVCPEAPTQSVTRPSRSVATMLIDIYMDGFDLSSERSSGGSLSARWRRHTSHHRARHWRNRDLDQRSPSPGSRPALRTARQECLAAPLKPWRSSTCSTRPASSRRAQSSAGSERWPNETGRWKGTRIELSDPSRDRSRKR